MTNHWEVEDSLSLMCTSPSEEFERNTNRMQIRQGKIFQARLAILNFFHVISKYTLLDSQVINSSTGQWQNGVLVLGNAEWLREED